MCTTKLCDDNIVSALDQTKSTWWHPSSRSNAGISTVHTKKALVGRLPTFSRIVSIRSRSQRLDRPTPMPCLTQMWQNWNHHLTRMKTRRILNQNRSTAHANIFMNNLQQTHRRQKSTWWPSTSLSRAGVSNTRGHSRWPFHFNQKFRESRQPFAIMAVGQKHRCGRTLRRTNLFFGVDVALRALSSGSARHGVILVRISQQE